jgi:phosphoglycerate dehydrogenase-like enzyme
MLNYPNIGVYKLHHNAAATAEMALSLLLAVAKRVLPFDQKMRTHDWRPRYQKSDTVLLEGKKALILGYGRIGKKIRGYLEALGVQVRIIKRTLTEQDSKEEAIFPPSKLWELLPETDILILALPHTDETDNLISHKELSLLPRNAILINISRGKIIDQEALFSTLKEDKIYGAGLDVWYNYPKTKGERSSTQPADYPFHELDNLVMSPHRGGKVKETEQLRMTALARSLNAAVRGEPIPNPVNIELGY